MGGTCIQLQSRYVCACPNGYTGSNCEQLQNPCTSTSCLNGGICTPLSGVYDFS